MAHSRNANIEPIRSAVDRVVEEVLGTNPVCPACGLRVKSERHFDKRAYRSSRDGKMYDAHVGLKHTFFGGPTRESLEALKARFAK